jgi:hypothetical protein
MDLEEFPVILADIRSTLQPLIDTTHILPQVKEVITLRRRLTRSIRALQDAVSSIPDAIESVHLHTLEEGALPNNIRANVKEKIRLQEARQRNRMAAAAHLAELRRRGDEVLEFRGGRRITKRRRYR